MWPLIKAVVLPPRILPHIQSRHILSTALSIIASPICQARWRGTSTYALNNVTLPHILNLAEKGWRRALREDNNLANGLNICHGKVTYPAVGEALGHKVSSTREMLQ